MTPAASHTACSLSTDSTADCGPSCGLCLLDGESVRLALRMCSRGVLLTRAIRIKSASSPTITAARWGGGGCRGNRQQAELKLQQEH